VRRDLDPHVAKLGEEQFEVLCVKAVNGDVARGGGPHDQVRPCFDAVGDDGVVHAVEGPPARHPHRARPLPLDLGTHAAEVGAEVGDLGLAGGVLDHRLALGGGRCHDEVLGRADARVVEGHDGATQLTAAHLDETMLDLDRGAQLLETAEVEVDAPGTDVASARHGDHRLAEARYQRSHDDDAGSHRPYELVRRAVVEMAGGADEQLVAVARHVDAEGAQHLRHGVDVADARRAPDATRLRRQQSGRHELERRVLGPGKRDVAEQATAAPDQQAPRVFGVPFHQTGSKYSVRV